MLTGYVCELEVKRLILPFRFWNSVCFKNRKMGEKLRLDLLLGIKLSQGSFICLIGCLSEISSFKVRLQKLYDTVLHLQSYLEQLREGQRFWVIESVFSCLRNSSWDVKEDKQKMQFVTPAPAHLQVEKEVLEKVCHNLASHSKASQILNWHKGRERT